MSTELVPSEASGGLLTIFGVPCGVEISLHFCPHFTWCSPCVCVCPNLLFLFLTVFVYLAALGLSRGTWDLCCSTDCLVVACGLAQLAGFVALQHVGS